MARTVPDPTLDTLLELDGLVLVVDAKGGHWVKFVVTRVPLTIEKRLLLDAPGRQRNAPGRVRQCSPGSTIDTAVSPRTARPSASVARESGLRVSRRRQPIGRFLDPGRRGVARKRSDRMTTLTIGIASYEEMKARTLAIARGKRKSRPGIVPRDVV